MAASPRLLDVPETSPPFSFDDAKLHALQAELPIDLQLLRLRLRFGLPLRVQLGQKFRVVVDLVDEMGQPPRYLEPPGDLDVYLASQRRGSEHNNAVEDDQLTLNVEKKSSPVHAKQRQTKWVFWVSLHSSTAMEDVAVRPSDIHASLRIQMKQKLLMQKDNEKDLSCSRRLLQQFCQESSWLSESTLVLPLQVELDVEIATELNDEVATSTVCQRLFCTLLWPRGNNDNDEERGLLLVEEHYGDAMGSHVWDASILLSFAVLQAGIVASKSSQQKTVAGGTRAMLELGSGCGLFATVLASFQSPYRTIFTEKSNCTELLRANLLRNGSPSALVLPLEWGSSLPSVLREAGVGVVFAADVLYNWAAHEALLDTLIAFEQEHTPTDGMCVFLAHKRRGKVSAAMLDALATGTFEYAAQCGVITDPTNCKWQQWHVDKLAALGRVELFQISRRA